MKTLKTIATALMILLVPQKPSPAVSLPLAGFCFAAAAGATVGIIYIYSRCGPKSYCVRTLNDLGQPEGSYYCLSLGTRADAAKLGVQIESGPYKSQRICFPSCDTNNFPVFNLRVPWESPSPSDFIPSFNTVQGTMHVLRCLDLGRGEWEEVDSFETEMQVNDDGSPEFCFERMLIKQPRIQAFYWLFFTPEL
jgi:hypothetical protein